MTVGDDHYGFARPEDEYLPDGANDPEWGHAAK